MKTTMDVWANLCQRFFSRKVTSTARVHPIHPCIIKGKYSYIYAPNLEKNDPQYFSELKTFAKKHHIQLRADQRISKENLGNSRRRTLLPIIFLTLGINTESIFAQKSATLNSLQFVDIENTLLIENTQQSMKNEFEQKNMILPPNEKERKILASILMNHYVAGDDDPITIQDDIGDLAAYYSSYPEVVILIQSISTLKWDLKFAPHTFQTDVIGSRLSVKKTFVYFDPRSGAKLRFYNQCKDKKNYCIASPADALLHELLHVQTVLSDTGNFIAQGGLNSVIYPYEHEHQTILKENTLYKTMTALDYKHRPIRNEHSGRHVLVSCVTCIN